MNRGDVGKASSLRKWRRQTIHSSQAVVLTGASPRTIIYRDLYHRIPAFYSCFPEGPSDINVFVTT